MNNKKCLIRKYFTLDVKKGHWKNLCNEVRQFQNTLGCKVIEIEVEYVKNTKKVVNEIEISVEKFPASFSVKDSKGNHVYSRFDQLTKDEENQKVESALKALRAWVNLYKQFAQLQPVISFNKQYLLQNGYTTY